MAEESSRNQMKNGKGEEEEEEEEDDYMGDLTRFLPQTSNPSKFSSEKIPDTPSLSSQPLNKKYRKLNRYERRHLEDQQTLEKVDVPIPESNIGFKMLKLMGYTPGSALGKDGSGIAEPLGLNIQRSRAGIGREEELKEKRKREEIEFQTELQRIKEKEEALMAEFGSWQKSQWHSRRVVINYRKAKAALDQLENKEIIVPKQNEDEEDGERAEEEEEEVTEEDLQDILIKLREEYHYCLFCGFQYESMEALLSNCPGTNEDDH